jgi:hypothetical protein
MVVYRAKAYMKDNALLGDNDYSFNFHVSVTGTSDDAWEKANEVAESYQGTLNPPNVTIYRVSIYNPDVVNGVQNRPVSLVGARTVTGDALPAWNVARLQSATTIGARIHTWFLRMGLTENDVEGQLLNSGVMDAIAAFHSALDLTAAFSDKDGQLFTTWLESDVVHMRQLGWHRRTRVGFHRGWVANTA